MLHIQNFKTLASFQRWADWFESYLVAHSEDRISRDAAYLYLHSNHLPKLWVFHFQVTNGFPCQREIFLYKLNYGSHNLHKSSESQLFDSRNWLLLVLGNSSVFFTKMNFKTSPFVARIKRNLHSLMISKCHRFYPNVWSWLCISLLT